MYSQAINQAIEPYEGTKVALFLDIDGVLHEELNSVEHQTLTFMRAEKLRVAIVDGKKDPQELGLLDPKRQELLAKVLERHPNVLIVLSSAWRNWEGSSPMVDDDLLWLKSLLHPTLASRIVGKTLSPDSIAADWQSVTRLQEIRRFMHDSAEHLGLCKKWIAVDDQVRHFPADVISSFFFEGNPNKGFKESSDGLIILVDGRKGLTQWSAKQLENAIRLASKGSIKSCLLDAVN